MATTRTVVSTAANQDGTASTTTTKVINTLVQELKLKYKITAAGDSTATAIVLKAAAARTGSALALNGKLTYSAPNGFASYDEMISFYKFISTNAYGLQIQTTDTDNYQDNFISIIEQDPTGLKRTITYDLSDYRTNVTGGYSDKIVLEESDINQIIWPGMEIQLSSIKPGSSMTFTWLLRGWNKVQELNAVQSQTLG